MGKLLSAIKTGIKSRLACFYSGMSRPLAIINTATIVIFGLLFFSIPAVSFIGGLHYITWALTILVLVLLCASFIAGNAIKIDYITICFTLFIIFAFISTALTKFIGFGITYFLLTIFLILTYTYSKSDIRLRKALLLSIYFGSILFLGYYALFYGKEMFSLGKIRLGNDFGDINDIAIFNGIGFTISLYYIFFSKKYIFKVLNIFLLPLFVLVILSSGSKIAYLFIPIVLIGCIFFKLGKKKWYLSIIITIFIIGLLVGILQLKTFESIRIKILSMVNVFLKVKSNDPLRTDGSTINRWIMFRLGCEMFLRKPLLGYGVNGFQYFGGYSDGTGWSHNHFSEVLSATGIIGFSLYDFPIFYSLYKGIKSKQYLPSLLLIFFIVTMISIALPGEKLFAYPIGVIISLAYSPADIVRIDIKEMLFKRFKEKSHAEGC